MKRRTFLGTGAVILGWPVAGVTQEAAGAEPPAVMFRLAKPAATSFLMVETEATKEPKGTKLSQLIWSRGSELEGADVVRLKDVNVIRPEESKDPDIFHDLRFYNMGAMPISLKNRGDPRPIEGHGMRHEAWLAGNPAGARRGMLRSPRPLEWSWAVMLQEKNEFWLYLAKQASVVDAAKGTVQLQGSVTIFGSEGFTLVDLAEVVIPSKTAYCQWEDQNGITSIKPMTRDEVMTEIKSVPRP